MHLIKDFKGDKINSSIKSIATELEIIDVDVTTSALLKQLTFNQTVQYWINLGILEGLLEVVKGLMTGLPYSEDGESVIEAIEENIRKIEDALNEANREAACSSDAAAEETPMDSIKETVDTAYKSEDEKRSIGKKTLVEEIKETIKEAAKTLPAETKEAVTEAAKTSTTVTTTTETVKTAVVEAAKEAVTEAAKEGGNKVDEPVSRLTEGGSRGNSAAASGVTPGKASTADIFALSGAGAAATVAGVAAGAAAAGAATGVIAAVAAPVAVAAAGVAIVVNTIGEKLAEQERTTLAGAVERAKAAVEEAIKQGKSAEEAKQAGVDVLKGPPGSVGPIGHLVGGGYVRTSEVEELYTALGAVAEEAKAQQEAEAKETSGTTTTESGTTNTEDSFCSSDCGGHGCGSDCASDGESCSSDFCDCGSDSCDSGDCDSACDSGSDCDSTCDSGDCDCTGDGTVEPCTDCGSDCSSDCSSDEITCGSDGCDCADAPCGSDCSGDSCDCGSDGYCDCGCDDSTCGTDEDSE